MNEKHFVAVVAPRVLAGLSVLVTAITFLTVQSVSAQTNSPFKVYFSSHNGQVVGVTRRTPYRPPTTNPTPIGSGTPMNSLAPLTARAETAELGADPISVATSFISEVRERTGAYYANTSSIGPYVSPAVFQPLHVARDRKTDMYHVRYRQTHNGTPVYGAEVTVHLSNDLYPKSINGRILSYLIDVPTTAIISDEAARVAALRYMYGTANWDQLLANESARVRPICSSPTTTSRVSIGKKSKSKKKKKKNTSRARSRFRALTEAQIQTCINQYLDAYLAEQLTGVSRARSNIYNKAFIRGQSRSGTTLAWVVRASTPDGGIAKNVIIDSQTGDLLDIFSLAHGADTPKPLNREVRDCHHNSIASSNICRVNSYSPSYDYTFGRSEGQPVRNANPVPGVPQGSTDVDIIYTDYLAGAFDYYVSKFGRYGANSDGGTGTNVTVGATTVPISISRVDANANVSNWTDDFPEPEPDCKDIPAFTRTDLGLIVMCTKNLDYMVYQGDLDDELSGSTFGHYDLFGHEYAHLVSANLQPQGGSAEPISLGTQGETGSLNESFSDIMGEAFERYRYSTNDWLFVTDSDKLHYPIGAYRSLSDPPSVNPDNPDPDRNNSNNVYCGDDNSIGIYKNAGIVNKAFYLATVGGTFNGCTVEGLGFDKTEQIWYRALMNYFQSTENFNQAYVSLISACNDLYSPADCEQLTRALRAVELNQPGKCNNSAIQPPSCGESTVPIPGDFDLDRKVDGNDFLIWQRQLGMTAPNPLMTADANNDGFVNSLDLDVWRQNYGINYNH